MSWIQELYKTYDQCEKYIGIDGNEDEKNHTTPLLPICHTTQMAHVEITLDEDGNFQKAKIINKAEARTIIPCTELSSNRVGNDAPHPLCDKLQFVAGDFCIYEASKKSFFPSYKKLLKDWCDFASDNKKIHSVFKYISKEHLIDDLMAYQIFAKGDDGTFLEKKKGDRIQDLPPIFRTVASQKETFIRWIVEIPGEQVSALWKDREIWKNWIDFYSKSIERKSFCIVSGKEETVATLHPAKIVSDGDKAKLISSNDKTDFTYRGRFQNAEQAAAINFIVTQKAHFALRWLLARQGYRNGDLGIVAWAAAGIMIPQPTDSPLEIISNMPEEPLPYETAQNIGIQFRKRIAGYKVELGNIKNIFVLATDAATTGRRAVTYFRQLGGSDYIDRIDSWHSTCSWLHRFVFREIKDPESGKKRKICIPFTGAAAPVDIAKAAFGEKIDEKLLRYTISRILPCIVEQQPLPRDLMESSVRRASNRISMEPWEWEKTLSIACALFRKYHEKEKYDMSLDQTNQNRDYLYGRLLAVAENLERWALNDSGEKRETNAARLMQRFSDHPFSTWRTIELALTPYKARLGAKSQKYQDLMDQIIASFRNGEFLNDNKLSGEFLLGYHCQREEFRSSFGRVVKADLEQINE